MPYSNQNELTSAFSDLISRAKISRKFLSGTDLHLYESTRAKVPLATDGTFQFALPMANLLTSIY